MAIGVAQAIKGYWIWWEDGVGLERYGQPVLDEFKPVYKSGNIAIYRYVSA